MYVCCVYAVVYSGNDRCCVIKWLVKSIKGRKRIINLAFADKKKKYCVLCPTIPKKIGNGKWTNGLDKHCGSISDIVQVYRWSDYSFIIFVVFFFYCHCHYYYIAYNNVWNCCCARWQRGYVDSRWFTVKDNEFSHLQLIFLTVWLWTTDVFLNLMYKHHFSSWVLHLKESAQSKMD